MSASHSSRHVLTAAIVAVLAFGTLPTVFPGEAGASERGGAREAARGGRDRKPAAAAAAEEFPAATRKDPGVRTSQRMAGRIDKVFKARDANDPAAVEAAAADVLGNDKANAYERAITLRVLAEVMMGADENARAKDYLRQTIEADGLDNNQHYGSLLTLAQLQMQDDEYAEGLATLDRLLAETHSDRADLQVLRGNALYRLERYDEAIAALEPQVKGNPEAKTDWVQLLMASYVEGGRPAEASVLAEQVAAQAPGDKRAQLNLAGIHLQNDEPAKAIAVYERLRQAGELTEEREYRNLAALYLNSEGGEANAISVLNEGLQKKVLKEDYNTYAGLAQAYYFTDQYDQAIEAYRKAAPLDDDGTTYLNLAKVLANEGRDAESKEAAQKALDKGLSNPDEARRLLSR